MIKSQPAEAFAKMEKEGFLKISRPDSLELTSEQKVALNRKGNELFSRGEIDQAKKIFVSTGYTDGMIRVGDHFAQQRDFLSALQMYKMAPAPDKAEGMIVNLTAVLRNWTKE